MTEYFERLAGLRMCRCKSSRRSHKLPCTANFGQQPYKWGPDISLLESHLQQQWDAAANGSLGEIVIYPMSCLKVQWSARIALMDIHMCGKQELMAGPMAKAAHTVLDRLCVSIIPLQQNSRKLLQNGILMRISLCRTAIQAQAISRLPGSAGLAAMLGELEYNCVVMAAGALGAAVSVPRSNQNTQAWQRTNLAVNIYCCCSFNKRCFLSQLSYGF